MTESSRNMPNSTAYPNRSFVRSSKPNEDSKRAENSPFHPREPSARDSSCPDRHGPRRRSLEPRQQHKRVGKVAGRSFPEIPERSRQGVRRIQRGRRRGAKIRRDASLRGNPGVCAEGDGGDGRGCPGGAASGGAQVTILSQQVKLEQDLAVTEAELWPP